MAVQSFPDADRQVRAMNDDRVLRITKGDWGNVAALYVAQPDPDLESVGHSIERPDSPGITADERQAYRVSLETAKKLQAFLTAHGYQVILELADDDPDYGSTTT